MPVVRARKNFSSGRKVIHAGDLFDSTDDVVVRFPSLFIGVEAHVEQATAAPGEKRAARKQAAKRVAAKPAEPADD